MHLKTLNSFALVFLSGAALTAVELNSRVAILEAQMNEISVRTVHENRGAKTASASPQISGEEWFFTGDLLWWQANEGGMDYAQIFNSFPATASFAPVENRVLTFKWDYGFRAGIGKTFQHDKWDLYTNFTWFQTENSQATSLHEGVFITPLRSVPLVLASQVKIHWEIDFYTLDLNLGRNYFVSPKLAFHPYLGLKGAVIDQHVNTHSHFISGPLLKAKDKNDFWGIGPSMGLEGKWFLDYGFHLFSSLGGAILWGDFTVRHKEIFPSFDVVRNKLDLGLHQIVPMTQFQLGLGYETNLYHNRYHLGIGARYEIQYWWNQNQMPYFSFFSLERFQRYAEDLSLQGITADVRFDF